MATGLGRMAEWIRSRAMLRRAAHGAVRFIPDWPLTIRTREIGPVRIRLRRHRWMLWQDFGEADALTFAMFRRLIRPGDVVYDIGANIGLYTRVMHTWFHAGTILAFEPMRENFELLKANIALGGADLQPRVQAFQIALSDVEGQEQLQIDDMTSGTAALSSVTGGEASVGRREFGLPPRVESVTVQRLDDFIAREQAPAPAFIKIDVEGAEAKVLAGGLQTLRRHRPRLCIALHGESMARDTLALLDDLGYLAFGYAVDAEARLGGGHWRQLHAIDAPALANNNIIASIEQADVAADPLPAVPTG